MHRLIIPKLLNFLLLPTLLFLCYPQKHQVVQGLTTVVEAGVEAEVEEGVAILEVEVAILMVGVEEARATMARLMEMLRQLLLLVAIIMEPNKINPHVYFVENNTITT